MTTQRRVVVDAARRRRAPEFHSVQVLVTPDDDPDTSYLDDEEFADRREAYQRGDFTFVGIRAEAEIVVDDIVQTIVSGGHTGIESDASDYIQEVAGEEYSDLRRILKTLGVPTSELPAEVDPNWIKWRM
jgi:hypothetical protein